MTEFHQLYEAMKENAGSVSTLYPKQKNVVCDKMLSLCDMIDHTEIQLNLYELCQWELYGGDFKELINRLRNVERENRDNSGKFNVLDPYRQEGYYLPVTCDDFIEWLNRDCLYDRMFYLFTSELWDITYDDYQYLIRGFEEEVLCGDE